MDKGNYEKRRQKTIAALSISGASTSDVSSERARLERAVVEAAKVWRHGEALMVDIAEAVNALEAFEKGEA